ncbi:hypothetical protein V3C99_007095 [Haemonchus contortus]
MGIRGNVPLPGNGTRNANLFYTFYHAASASKVPVLLQAVVHRVWHVAILSKTNYLLMDVILDLISKRGDFEYRMHKITTALMKAGVVRDFYKWISESGELLRNVIPSNEVILLN